MSSWTKCHGIWSIDFKVKGNRFSIVVAPRIDMSDMDDERIVDLEKLHEHQLYLSRGPHFAEKDDIFLGYYPDRLMAANAGLQVVHYMNGKIMRARPKLTFVLYGILAAIFTLMAWPTVTKRAEITTVVAQPPAPASVAPVKKPK